MKIYPAGNIGYSNNKENLVYCTDVDGGCETSVRKSYTGVYVWWCCSSGIEEIVSGGIKYDGSRIHYSLLRHEGSYFSSNILEEIGFRVSEPTTMLSDSQSAHEM